MALDARAPKFDGGIATRLDSVPFGIAVNKFGQRFYDEGEDFWPKRYAIWGRLIAEQPDQIAYSIIDSRMLDRFPDVAVPALRAETRSASWRSDGAGPGGGDGDGRGVQRGDRARWHVRSGTLDDCRTEGLQPPKSHWAVPIAVPPFYGYALRPGITFTYMGLPVDERTRVQMDARRPLENLFAAGEIMSGNILSYGYLAGFGLTIGTVFGRIAGTQAGELPAAAR